MDRPDIKDIHILTHPLRFKIVQTLKRTGRPMFVAEIAEAVEAEDRLVSFHLATLVKGGFVKGEWHESRMPRSKGKAVKYHELTPKVDETLSKYAMLAYEFTTLYW